MGEQYPSTEEAIAAICGYQYLQENVISAACKAEQRESIMDNYYLNSLGQSSICGCEVINDNCCSDKTCPNRQIGLACSVRCYRQCANNPWARNTFAINEGKLYVAPSVRKGKGIFAKELIRKDTLLGELTGVVSRLDFSRNDVSNRLFFYLGNCDHVIDPSKQGSAMRMVNNSNEPNARAVVYVHNGVYKVVYEAMRDIKPKEEVTVNNGWKFKQTTANNPVASASGAGQEELELEYPETFPNVLLSGSARVQMLFDVDVQPRPFNPSHEEKHIFCALEEVAVIVNWGQLAVTLGRIAGCYKNEKNDYFYVVRSNNPKVKDYHLPMYLVFRHRETAQYVLDDIYSKKVKCYLRRYLNGPQRMSHSETWDPQNLKDYIDTLKSAGMPALNVKERNLEGCVSIGMTPVYLKKAITGQPLPSRWGATLLHAGFKGFRYEIKRETLQVIPKQEVVLERVLKAGGDVSNHFEDQVLSSKVFDNVVTTVVSLWMTRQEAGEAEMSFQKAHEIVCNFLRPYYFGSDPRRRRFLLYSQYRMALEMTSKGSLYLRWCGFCRMPNTFESEVEFMEHYYKKHAICGRGYVCYSCPMGLKCPSEIRHHMYICTPELTPFLRADMRENLLDALFDYTVVRRHESISVDCVTKHRACVIFSRPKTKIEMDVESGKPLNGSIRVHHTAFTTLQTNCSVAEMGNNLTYECEVSFSGNAKTNEWETPVCT